jgi:chaperonin GroEL
MKFASRLNNPPTTTKKTVEQLVPSGGVVISGAHRRRDENRKEAFEDAISATKAAMAEGIVPGGGLALLRAIEAVERAETQCAGDERTGLYILKRALEAPTRQIAENSNFDGGVVVDRMRKGTGNFGFDAARSEYVDLVEAGIIDPTKVVRLALENAVSVAGVLLLTEATLTECLSQRQNTRRITSCQGSEKEGGKVTEQSWNGGAHENPTGD